MDRRLLAVTVYLLPVLVTVLAVVMTAAWLLEGINDVRAALWVRIGGGVILMALCVDVLLLLGLLGFRSIREIDDLPEPPV